MPRICQASTFFQNRRVFCRRNINHSSAHKSIELVEISYLGVTLRGNLEWNDQRGNEGPVPNPAMEPCDRAWWNEPDYGMLEEITLAQKLEQEERQREKVKRFSTVYGMEQGMTPPRALRMLQLPEECRERCPLGGQSRPCASCPHGRPQ